MTLGAPFSVNSGESELGATAGKVAGVSAPPTRTPELSCPSDPESVATIRSNLPLRADPPDLDPTAESRPYRFGPAFFLKSP